jgi:Xaa-Pro aminopeptidase
MWPSRSPSTVFADRRRRLAARFSGPLVLASGFSRPRNLPGVRHVFRAESHFAYLVGPAPEGAALFMEGGREALYVQNPDPLDELWVGAQPSLGDVAEARGIEVRPIDELDPPPTTATLPPQDAETAAWLAGILGRPIDAGGGDELDDGDAGLADAMIALRLTHDTAALVQMREALVVTREAHLAGLRATRPGVREAAVRGAMEGAMLGAGMVTAYPPIVTRRGEILHCETHEGLLEEGDLLLVDAGAETPEGWASDVTRTWPVSGRFSPTQRALYDLVLAVQRGAIDEVRPGRRYREVHRVASRFFVEGLVSLGILRGAVEDLVQVGAAAWFFPHGVGHLLGLDVHDLEDLGDRAGYAPGRERSTSPGDRYLRLDRDLAPGMVVTIEPGFYRIPSLLAALADGPSASFIDFDVLEKFHDVRGIRIEDDVLVTDDGAEVLSAAIPKDAGELERILDS